MCIKRTQEYVLRMKNKYKMTHEREIVFKHNYQKTRKRNTKLFTSEKKASGENFEYNVGRK